MPDASIQTDPIEMQTQTAATHTRRELTDSTKKKYVQAVKRLTDAKLNLHKPDEVMGWMKEKELGESAMKVYLSALKYHFSVENMEFPKKYQKEIDRLYHRQNEREEDQELTKKQVENFVKYEDLLKVQRALAAIPDKSEFQWRKYLIASLYTLNAPIRADYGEMVVSGRADPRNTQNQLIWSSKPVFVLREYKTKDAFGVVKIPVSKELQNVIGEWFEHYGGTPKWLLGAKVSPNALLGEIAATFSSTGKHVGVNLLRHAYIVHHYPSLKTIKQKEDLARRMLHSRDRQELYNSQNV